MSREAERVSGWHAVLAVLKKRPCDIDTLWLAQGRTDRRAQAVLAAARAAGVKIRLAPRATLDRLAAGAPHQGVVARLRTVGVRSERELEALLASLPERPLLLVLDGVQDPHNLGACLRVADAAGVQAVIAPRDNTAPMTDATRRAAAGAAETVPFFQVANLARILRTLKDAGIWVIGTAAQSQTTLFQADLRRPCALVLGGEGKGLRRLTREYCDTLVRIPMAGTIESLNVSVAAGICLFEAVRQRIAARREP